MSCQFLSKVYPEHVEEPFLKKPHTRDYKRKCTSSASIRLCTGDTGEQRKLPHLKEAQAKA
jgi:hypothetical protein